MSPLLRENGRMPAAFVGDVNSLLWNFIQPLFFTEFSYWAILISAAFLHWISSMSYPHSITLYILNKHLIKQLFPDPRLRRLSFEYPGSARAGPQQSVSNVWMVECGRYGRVEASKGEGNCINPPLILLRWMSQLYSLAVRIERLMTITYFPNDLLF